MAEPNDPHDDATNSGRDPAARDSGSPPKETARKADDVSRDDRKKDDGAARSGDKSDKSRSDGSGNSDKPPDEPDKPSPLSKPWVRVVIGIVVVVALIAGIVWFYRWYTHGRFVQDTDNAYLKADQVSVTSQVSGTAAEVFVGDNQNVRAGDLLVRLDDSASRAKVDQARGAAAQALSSIGQFRAQIGEQEATIAQARAALDGALADLAHAQGELDRYSSLAATGAETMEKLAQMRATRDEATATVRQDRAALAQAERHVATLRAQIGGAQAQAAQADAQARQAQVDVDNALIRAGIDGRVGDRQVRLGMSVQVGTRLMTLVPVQALYLVANFKETQIGLMRVGQPATITVDALDGVKIEGTVDSFAPATGAEFALIPPNNATGNFTKIVQRVPVRIRIDAGPQARKVLVPGLSVEVAVDTLGNKAGAEERDDEAARDKRTRQDEHDDQVARDRRQAASGAGQ